jgi:hypothetical protein
VGFGRVAMTITVDISPEVQAEFARQAASHGRAIEAYAASLHALANFHESCG